MAERRPIVNPTGLAEHVNTDTLNVGQGPVFVEQASSLTTPASGYAVLYAKTDGKLYFKNDAGTETDLTATSGGTNPVIREYIANDTWTKPTAANFWGVMVIAVGAGGGGGSGRKGSASESKYGGGGGGGGAVTTRIIRVANLPNASYSITIGSGGTGAAARTTLSNGATGNNGGNTQFGTLVIAPGGSGGSGGTTGAGNAGAGGSIQTATPARGPYTTGGAGGGNSSNVATAGGGGFGQVNTGGPGGGAGGGMSATNTVLSGGLGGGVYDINVLTNGGAAGTTSGTRNASPGTSDIANNYLFDIDNATTYGIGTGGGGGASGDAAGTIAGGSGGNAGRCAGGGGGGSSINTADSGAGGNGGNGLLYVVEYYGA